MTTRTAEEICSDWDEETVVSASLDPPEPVNLDKSLGAVIDYLRVTQCELSRGECLFIMVASVDKRWRILSSDRANILIDRITHRSLVAILYALDENCTIHT